MRFKKERWRVSNLAQIVAVWGVWAHASHAYDRMGETRQSNSLHITLGVSRCNSAHLR